MGTNKVKKNFLTLLISCLDHLYNDWVGFFRVQKQYYQLGNIVLTDPDYRSLVISYIQLQIIGNCVENERICYIVQFLSFIKRFK